MVDHVAGRGNWLFVKVPRSSSISHPLGMVTISIHTPYEPTLFTRHTNRLSNIDSSNTPLTLLTHPSQSINILTTDQLSLSPHPTVLVSVRGRASGHRMPPHAHRGRRILCNNNRHGRARSRGRGRGWSIDVNGHPAHC